MVTMESAMHWERQPGLKQYMDVYSTFLNALPVYPILQNVNVSQPDVTMQVL